MKKIYQIVAVAALAFLVTDANAQNAPVMPKGHMVAVKRVHSAAPARLYSQGELRLAKTSKNNSVNRTMTTTNAFTVDYANLDATAFQGSYYYFSPMETLNKAYGIADSGTTSKNYNEVHAAIVAFDTLVDSTNAPHSAGKGTLTVEQVGLTIGYHNTTGDSVLMIVNIIPVSLNGYPSFTTPYSTDTIVIAAHSHILPGLASGADSLYDISIVPNSGNQTLIPASAAYGFHYAVQVEVVGSKLDSLGVWFGASTSPCGADFIPNRTILGPKMGAAANINSFMTGFEFYQPAGSTNIPLTWPDDHAKLYNANGEFQNGKADYWNIDPNCSAGADTAFPYFQDIYINTLVSFSDVTGINNISNSNDFSINQNFPNPFNKATQITYNLAKASDVMFSVYDLTGRELIKNNYSTVAPGQHAINLEANQFTPGIYFYTFNVGDTQVTKKMIVTQ